eukprot:Pgem_evm1s1055
MATFILKLVFFKFQFIFNFTYAYKYDNTLYKSRPPPQTPSPYHILTLSDEKFKLSDCHLSHSNGNLEKAFRLPSKPFKWKSRKRFTILSYLTAIISKKHGTKVGSISICSKKVPVDISPLLCSQ